MAKISIGGRDYQLPELVLAQIRKIGPRVNGLVSIKADDDGGLDDDAIQAMLDTLEIWLAPTSPDLTAAVINDRLKFREFQAAPAAILEGLRESGLLKGEAPGGAAPATTSPLVSKSTGSSASSSRRGSRAAAGGK